MRESTEKNCNTLETIYKNAKSGLVSMEPYSPYTNTSLSIFRGALNLNVSATATIDTQLIKPKSNKRVLGAHIRKIQKKMVNQSMALTKTSTSTWGASFSKARRIHIAVICPVMIYSCLDDVRGFFFQCAIPRFFSVVLGYFSPLISV